MYLEEFKNDIRINSLSFEQLFQKYFIDKSTFYFENFSTNDDEYALKAEIANLLNRPLLKHKISNHHYPSVL